MCVCASVCIRGLYDIVTVSIGTFILLFLNKKTIVSQEVCCITHARIHIPPPKYNNISVTHNILSIYGPQTRQNLNFQILKTDVSRDYLSNKNLSGES